MTGKPPSAVSSGHLAEPDHHCIDNGQVEVTRLPRRYIIELEQTPDDRVEGTLRRDGAPETVPFSGWTELLSLLEPPPRLASTPEPGRGLERTHGNGRPNGLPRPF